MKLVEQINAWKEERSNLVGKMRVELDKSIDEKREMSSDEETAYNNMQKELDGYNAKIDRSEKLLLEERKLGENKMPSAGSQEGRSQDPGEEERRAAFASYLQTGEIQNRDMFMSTDANGGYLVADQKFSSEVIKSLNDAVQIRQHARILTLDKAKTLGFPQRTAKMASGTWGGELDAPTKDSQLAFGKREFKLNYYTNEILVSLPLIRSSSVDVYKEVQEAIAEIVGIDLEQAYMLGDGVNKPLGLYVASDNGIPTSRDVVGSNTTTEVKADTIYDMLYALRAPYRKNAKFMFHRNIMKDIMKMKNQQDGYLWQPSLVAGQPDHLIGKAVMESELAPATKTANSYVGICGNFNRYWIADSLQLEIQVLKELYARENKIGYLVRLQTDGAPVDPEAFVRMKMASA